MDTNVAMRNFLIYSSVSTALMGISIASLMNDKSNFYSLLISISHGIHFIIFGNFLIILMILMGKLLQKILFGELRSIECENVYERSWYTMMFLLMAVSTFRDENNLLIGVWVLILLFLKIFHWILMDRIQYIFQSNQSMRKIIFTRATVTLVLFLVLDYKMVWDCVENSFHSSPDVYAIFGFDFALLFFDLFEEFGKLILNLIEIWYLKNHEDDDVWEWKSIIMKIFEISISFIKLNAIFFIFFILIGPSRMTFTVLRESYLTISKFISQISDLIRDRRVLKELNSKLQDATQLDLDHDDICLICRDEMSIDVAKDTRSSPKRLNCGHVIHLGCLKSWMERSESCPMCRSSVFATPVRNMSSMNEVNGVNDADNRDGVELQLQPEPQPEPLPELQPEPLHEAMTQSLPQPLVQPLTQPLVPQSTPEVNRQLHTPLNTLNTPLNRQRDTQSNRQPNTLNPRADRVDPVDPVETNIFSRIIRQVQDRLRPPPPTAYHSPIIELPSNSIILPPDWSLFPLTPISNGDPRNTTEYEIYFNTTTKARLRIVDMNNQNLQIISFPNDDE